MLSNIVCLFFGVIVSQCVQGSQHLIRGYFRPKSAAFIAISRLFAIIWGIADIYLWKAIWDGVNCTFPSNAVTGSCTFVIAVIGLEACGALRSVASVPVGVVLDDAENQCHAATYFKTTVRTIIRDNQRHKTRPFFCRKPTQITEYVGI